MSEQRTRRRAPRGPRATSSGIDALVDAITEALPGIAGSAIVGKLTGSKVAPVMIFMTEADLERRVRKIVREEVARAKVRDE